MFHIFSIFWIFSSKWFDAVYNAGLREASNEFSRAFQCIHGIYKESKEYRKIPELKSNGWILILKAFCLKNERFSGDQVSSQIHVLQNLFKSSGKPSTMVTAGVLMKQKIFIHQKSVYVANMCSLQKKNAMYSIQY